MEEFDNKKKLFDLQNERVCLASLIKFPSSIGDLMNVIKPKMFYDKTNEVIFSMILALWSEKGSVDPNLLVAKLYNSGFQSIGKINTSDYIEALTFIPVSKESIRDYFMDGVFKYYWLRDQYTNLSDARKQILINSDKPLGEILPIIEKKVQSSAIQVFDEDDGGFDIYEHMMEKVLSWGNERPQIGLKTPYEEFNKRYEGLTFGDLTMICAPAKIGKSTFLDYTAFGCAGIPENNCKVIIFDGELEGDRVLARGASALSGVNESMIKKGTFKDNKVLYNKVLGIEEQIKNVKGKIKHYFVPDKNIDEIISMFRRWYYLNVKDGENVLFIYDYLKLTGEQTSGHNPEYQIITEKATKIKHLMSEFPRTTGLCAVQLTDEGNISQAKRIGWVASNVFKLFKKTPEDIVKYGENYGTHKLIPFLTRIMGDYAAGFEDYLQTEETDAYGNVKKKFEENYINFKLDKFKVEEKGSLQDMIKVVASQMDIEHSRSEVKPKGKLKYEREGDRMF
jgi:replicative DNA helicase